VKIGRDHGPEKNPNNQRRPRRGSHVEEGTLKRQGEREVAGSYAERESG